MMANLHTQKLNSSAKATPTQRVLLVDDSEIDLIIHEKILRKSSPALFIDMEQSAQTAIDLLKLRKIEDQSTVLIFLDINMPSMNGFEFLEAFTLLPIHIRKVCKVVMVSSSSLEVDKQRAAKYDFVINYLEKPLDPNQLINLISPSH